MPSLFRDLFPFSLSLSGGLSYFIPSRCRIISGGILGKKFGDFCDDITICIIYERKVQY